MTISEVIEELKSASEGSRQLDVAISQVVGWKNPAGPSGDGTTPARVPMFTSTIKNAYDLAQFVAPSHVGGVKWHEKGGSARIHEDGPFVDASTPALALCAAALLAYKQQS